MSKENFVKFYSEYLPQNPALKSEIEAITNEEQFTKKVLAEGSKAGFEFTHDEVFEVMKASEQAVIDKNSELSEAALDAVAGGTLSSYSTVQIGTLSTQNILDRSNLDPNAMSTVMCCW